MQNIIEEKLSIVKSSLDKLQEEINVFETGLSSLKQEEKDIQNELLSYFNDLIKTKRRELLNEHEHYSQGHVITIDIYNQYVKDYYYDKYGRKYQMDKTCLKDKKAIGVCSSCDKFVKVYYNGSDEQFVTEAINTTFNNLLMEDVVKKMINMYKNIANTIGWLEYEPQTYKHFRLCSCDPTITSYGYCVCDVNEENENEWSHSTG